jgi:sulfite exporter TauE/SafE
MFIILMKGEIPPTWAMSLEFLVGVMLVYFGIATIVSFKKLHANRHEYEYNHKHVSYNKSLFMGLVHGLAGSAAMILLTMTSVSSNWQGAIYMLVFGVGTVLGMLFFTTIIGIPFVLSTNKISLNKTLTQMTGLISTAFGVYYMYDLGINEGLFKLWIQ